jgi:hypothetical protein
MLLLIASSSMTDKSKSNLSELDQLWNREQDLISSAMDSESWRQDIVIGIPTIARVGNPDYLVQSVSSLLTVGNLSESQLFVLHGKPKEQHSMLSRLQQWYPNIHYVNQDTNASAMSPYYVVTNSSSKRAIHAFIEDDIPRKRWRISEAHDFLWLCRHMLSHSNASYIGFHQDDARLIDPLPDRLHVRLDGSTILRQMISLYSDHTPRESRRFCSIGGLFCGMVSLLFRRSALEEFLMWLEPIYKEIPIDWNLEAFLVSKNYLVPVHARVQHLGTISSMQGKSSILDDGMMMMNVQQVPNEWFNKHRVAFADRIVHNCPFQEDQYHATNHHQHDNSHKNNTATTLTIPLVSWGVVYTVPSNQLMQHVVYHFRNKSCLRLASLKVLPPTPMVGTGMARTHAAVQLMLENLNRRYSGYEEHGEVQAIPVLDEKKIKALPLDAVAMTQFVHVANYLLKETQSPLLGFSYDDMLPVVRVDWESLQRKGGITSLYMEPQLQHHQEDDPIDSTTGRSVCGQTVRCGFESMVFARGTLRDFVHWISSQNPTSSSLEKNILEFSREHNLTIQAMNVTRLIGKNSNERIKP